MRISTFKGRDVLELGCGPGHHLSLVARPCRHATGVDLNAIASARRHIGHLDNVTLIEGDLATLNLVGAAMLGAKLPGRRYSPVKNVLIGYGLRAQADTLRARRRPR